MRIFLTGHRGFIGAHLMTRLYEFGSDVRTDIRDFYAHQYDAVIHLAARTHIGAGFDPALFESNIVFARKIMHTPARLIYASSCSAAHLTNPYAYTKVYNEYLGTLHPDSLGLRFHNVYGEGNNKGLLWFLMQQKDAAHVTINGPELIRDYIHVDDVVDYIVGCLDSGRGIVDVGTGVGTKTIEFVNLYCDITGKKFVLNFAPHGINEPHSMISSNRVPAISLKEGLTKLTKDG